MRLRTEEEGMTGTILCRGLVAGLLLGLVAPVAAARADADSAKNRVSFGVERSREVENDWVTALVGVTHEDTDPARLADRINQDVSWALGVAKGTEGVRVRTGGYRTHPIEDPKRAVLRRWRGGQDLVLEGADPTVVSALLGQLQERLQLRSLRFSISPERRRAVEAELIDEALAAYRARAQRVSGKLGAKGYELVNLQVDASGGPPVPVRARAMAMAEAAVAPPALEGGTSTLSARAHGTIELEF
jgi:predicted secreted protein